MKSPVFGNELVMTKGGGGGVKDDSFISGFYNRVLNETHH